MDDRSESRDEMEVSPKRNDNCQNTFQDESEESNRDTTTYGNQALLSVQQETLENQQLPSGISSETPLPSVPTPTSTSQTQNSDELDEIFSSKDVFYSSRKLRIRTKCSQDVDAVLTNRQHLAASIYHSRQSARNIAALGNRVLPSLGQETAESQQAPAGISSETCSRLSVPTISYSSPAQDFNLLDETFSNDDAFYSSRDLRIRTNCSRSLDALLSPRRNLLGRIDVRLSPQQNLTTSFRPIFEQSDAGDVTDRRDRSPLGECRDIKMASPPELFEVRITRSLSKALKQKSPTPSPEEWSVEKGIRPTSSKRKRTQSPKSESDQWGATLESSVPKVWPSAARTLDVSPINVQTPEMRNVAGAKDVPESFTREETPKKRKREIMESSSYDADSTNDAIKSYSSFSTLVTNIDLESPTDLQTRESKAVMQDRTESVNADNYIDLESPTDLQTPAVAENKTISSRDDSPVSNLLLVHSNPDDTNLTRSFVNVSMEEYKATIPSYAFIDISSGSSNEDSRKRGEESSDSNIDIALRDLPEKESESLKRRPAPTDESSSSKFEPTSNSQIAATEDCQPCMEAKTDELLSASNMAHSATKIQLLESSKSRPIIENPVIQFPRGLFAGTETRGLVASASSIALSNSPSSEQSSSANINASRQDLEFVTNKEREGTNRNRSNSSTSASKQNSKSKPESFSKIRHMLLNPEFEEPFNSSGMYPGILMPRNRTEVLLERHFIDSISSEASRVRALSEAGMDLDAPYLYVPEVQPSTSRYQPVIADGSVGVRFSSPGVTASGEERGRVIESNTSTNRISKYISNARKLLLTVLEEIMKFNEEKSLYRRFSKLFLRISVLSCYKTEEILCNELLVYMRKNVFDPQEEVVKSSPIAERYTQDAYYVLKRIVVASLISTLLNLDFDFMMTNYKALKGLYERCLQFWRDDNEEIPDEDSRNRVAFLKKMIQRLLLQTRNAFKELLVYIGENAVSKIADSYEEYLWEEDKIFLRRQFL